VRATQSALLCFEQSRLMPRTQDQSSTGSTKQPQSYATSSEVQHGLRSCTPTLRRFAVNRHRSQQQQQQKQQQQVDGRRSQRSSGIQNNHASLANRIDARAMRVTPSPKYQRYRHASLLLSPHACKSLVTTCGSTITDARKPLCPDNALPSLQKDACDAPRCHDQKWRSSNEDTPPRLSKFQKPKQPFWETHKFQYNHQAIYFNTETSDHICPRSRKFEQPEQCVLRQTLAFRSSPIVRRAHDVEPLQRAPLPCASLSTWHIQIAEAPVTSQEHLGLSTKSWPGALS
jgi:hypothetical protein